MNFDLIRSADFQKLCEQYADENISELALQLSRKKNFPLRELLQQIEGRQKAKDKLPSFFREPRIVYPSKISLEQCSSEATARFKTGLFKGKVLADLTGGFGVDAFFFAENFEKVIYVEKENELAAIAENNFPCLGKSTVEVWNMPAEKAIESMDTLHPDLVFADPSRRDKYNRKLLSLRSGSPDIVELKDKIFEHSPALLIKASPMLDIEAAIKELKQVSKVWVISAGGECKELLFLLKKDFRAEAEIHCIELPGNHAEFAFQLSEEKSLPIHSGEISEYLYQPNISILKAGAFKTLAKRFGLSGLHAASTHLYTSEHLHDNFPGNIFKVTGHFRFDKQKIKNLSAVNVITRNVPYNSSELKKELQLKESRNIWLFVYRDYKNKIACAVAEKIFLN